MNYIITQEQLTCINILIRILQESINRECFSEDEIEKIFNLINKLTKKIIN
jgi:hypothetical protein